MKFYKKLLKLAIVISVLLTITACTTNKSYTFNIETGDAIKIKLDTTGDYTLSEDSGRFSVGKGDEEVLQGIFITKEAYEQYQGIKDLAEAKVIADAEKDGNTYFFYELEGESGTENNFVLWIKDSNTGLILGSLSGEETAKEAFERLTITLE